jgi:membrane protein DedA with SNARE-associated domain
MHGSARREARGATATHGSIACHAGCFVSRACAGRFRAMSSALRWGLILLAVGLAIVVPFLLWEEALVTASRGLLASPGNRLTLATIAAGLLAADLVLPVPSSLVSALAVAALGPVPGGLCIFTGMTLGALAGYGLGRSGGRAAALRCVGASELARAEHMVERMGPFVLVVCRGAPVLAEASVLLAGLLRLRPSRFLWITSLSHAGLALAYGVSSALSSSPLVATLLPFGLGLGLPAVSLVVARFFEGRPGERS